MAVDALLADRYVDEQLAARLAGALKELAEIPRADSAGLGAQERVPLVQ